MEWTLAGVAVVGAGAFLGYRTLFRTIEVSIIDHPLTVGKPFSFYYKTLVGPYYKAFTTVREAKSIVPSGTGCGIYYDDPAKVDTSCLRSAVGCIANDFDTATLKKLIAAGFKRADLAGISRAVTASTPVSMVTACLPVANPIARLYSEIKQFAVSRSLSLSCALEVYEDGKMRVIFPLENADGLRVPEAR